MSSYCSVFSKSAVLDSIRAKSKEEMVTDYGACNPARNPYLNLIAAVERHRAGLSVFGITEFDVGAIKQHVLVVS